jgi:hypothetical protein
MVFNDLTPSKIMTKKLLKMQSLLQVQLVDQAIAHRTFQQ